MEQETKGLINYAINSDDHLIALSATHRITDEKFLKLIGEETKHLSVKWIVALKLTDIEYLKGFSSDDSELRKSVKERIELLEKKKES